MAYTPTQKDYGELPETIDAPQKRYPISESNVPETAKEVLVYLWATTKGDSEFHRYYYSIETTDGTQSYSQYMNIAASQSVSLNSANLWLPVFGKSGRCLLDVKLK